MKAIADTIAIDARAPDPGIIVRTAEMVREGAVVVFPTRGLYGLGADAFNAHAVERIFKIKRRPARNPLLVLIDRLDMLERVALPVSDTVRALMLSFWPGRVTFVVPGRKGLPPGVTAGSGKIGVRLAAHPVAVALVRALGSPLTGTSANLAGSAGCAGIADLDPSVRRLVDIVLDAGPLAGGPGSTVVDVCGPVPVILRPGCVAPQAILNRFHELNPA